MSAQTQGKEVDDDDDDVVLPLLKTCVKCGSEKPACVNCIKYRCTCVYQPSVRHMRSKAHRSTASSSSSGSITKTYKQRTCVSPEMAGAVLAAAAAVESPTIKSEQTSDGALHSGGLSLSQLMKPVVASSAAPARPPGDPALIARYPSGSGLHQRATVLPHLLRHQRTTSTAAQPHVVAGDSSQQASSPPGASYGWRMLPPLSVVRTAEQQSQRTTPASVDNSNAAAAADFPMDCNSRASFGGSASSVGSPSGAYSPLVGRAGVDPRQLEASLASTMPDTLDSVLKAFFRYQYPCAGIVQEEFFWFRYRRKMLTPLIIYGMLAVATWNLASDEHGEGYANIHEELYCMAKRFVEDAMDEAHLRSVQGLLVLANYEALVGRWGTMWNHTTMARRLAEGIIFRDTDFPWVGVQRDTFDFEVERVHRAYWHSLINDICAAVLMDKQIGGIEINLPPRPTYDFTYRQARMSDSAAAPGYTVDLGVGALQDPRWGNTAASGALFLVVGAINNAAYLFQHAGKAPAFESFIDFEMRLTDWYVQLPQNVRLEDATIARFTATAQRADLGEIISTHMFWNFARLLLMKMGLVLSLQEDPSMLRNIYDNKAFYATDSRALQFYQSSMPILTPDKAASYDQWLFHFCRCMSLQSAQNVVNLLKLGERHGVHPGHFGIGLSLPLVQVVAVSLGLVHSPDPQVVQIAVDHLATIIRTLLRLKHWFNTAQLLLHLFVAMQDAHLVLPRESYVAAGDSAQAAEAFGAIEASCPFPPSHLITELMRRLGLAFDAFVAETARAVRMSTPTKSRIDPCITPLLRHLPAESCALPSAQQQEPDWFKYAPSYLRSAWKRLIRTYKPSATT